MIARLWHGWTRPENAAPYEALLTNTILPGIHRVAGYRGAYLLRRDRGAEVEFVTITLFESMEAVKGFAGEDYAQAVIEPEPARLLARFDRTSEHYEIRLAPDGR